MSQEITTKTEHVGFILLLSETKPCAGINHCFCQKEGGNLGGGPETGDQNNNMLPLGAILAIA